eukprot:scaffold10448_cov68-Phaeocystis_antarctica.AAC.2
MLRQRKVAHRVWQAAALDSEVGVEMELVPEADPDVDVPDVRLGREFDHKTAWRVRLGAFHLDRHECTLRHHA